MADCFDENVTNAQPLLWPFWSRSTVHSSMVPCPENSCRTSFSLNFLFSIPTKSFRSEKKSDDASLVHILILNYMRKFALCIFVCKICLIIHVLCVLPFTLFKFKMKEEKNWRWDEDKFSKQKQIKNHFKKSNANYNLSNLLRYTELLF